MTIPVINATSVYESLTSAPSSSDLLFRLKDVKNALIGNPLRKAEIVRSRELLGLLTEYVHVEQSDGLDLTRLEILNEAAVILGSIANSSGDCVLDSLLCVHLHSALLSTISILTISSAHDAGLESYILSKALPSLVRALRNHLTAIADYLWGWGSRAEPGTRVVLDSSVVTDAEECADVEMEGKSGESSRRARARAALLGVFKPKAVNALLSLLTKQQLAKEPQIVLPLLQLLAQTTILPFQRSALYNWNRQVASTASSSEETITDERRGTVRFSPPESPSRDTHTTSPLVDALCAMVLGNGPLGTKANSNFKLKQAGLDLLTVLVKDRPAAVEAMSALHSHEVVGGESGTSTSVSEESESNQLGIMTELLDSRVPGIGISAAACLVSFVVISGSQATPQAEDNRDARRFQASTSSISGMSLLSHLCQFMESAQPVDERIKACYLTAKLVQGDTDLQRRASDTSIISRCIEIVKLGDRELHSTESKDTSAIQSPFVRVGPIVAGRMVEASLTAIAALCAFHEPAKQKAISLGILPLLNRSLHSSAYSTRTAACQVARVLSRSIAILRTTLVDSGVAKSVVELLRAEEQIYAGNGGYDKDAKDRLSASGAVLTAATATICNLICEFPPMQTTFIAQDGIQTLVRLTDAPDREVRINSIWALRNMVFKSEESVRQKVMETLGWETLKRHLQDPQPEVAEQALAFTRNLIAEASEAEISRLFDGLGEEALFEAINSAMSGISAIDMNPEGDGAVGRPEFKRQDSDSSQSSDCLEQALFVLYNIALGNAQHREAILKRPNVLTGMRHALYTESPLIKIPAIGGFINLVETNDRHRRTRQEVINRLRPYLLPGQVRALCSDQSFDVRDKAGKLLAILEVGMYGAGSGSAAA